MNYKIEFKRSMPANDNLVVVTYTSSKTYQDLSGQQPKKQNRTVIMESTTTFNLNKNSVKFNFSYKALGHSKGFDNTTLNVADI